MTVTEHIYAAAGSPPMRNTTRGRCALCGATGQGVAFTDWVKDSFMDYDKLKAGAIICQACQFCSTDQSVILQTKLGRDKPQRMRNYSHFVSGGEWQAYHKGQKSAMAQALEDPSCAIAVISLSGQKHILFRARPGWWQIEEQRVLPFRGRLAELISTIRPMLTVFAKGEIERGYYAQHRILKFGVTEWWERESTLKPYRGSIHLQLAVWLSQKEDDGTESGTGQDDAGRDLARDSEGV